MRTVTLAAPERSGNRVLFRWHVEPRSDLYRREQFTLDFPDGVDLDRVPEPVWWYVALVSLHTHWLLLRPCVVRLPVTLPRGEREFWLRLLEIEGHATDFPRETAGEAFDKTLAIEESGPPLPAVRPCPGEGFVSAFSGGKDSLTQAALLCDAGVRPLLVTVKSHLPPHHDLELTRRTEILDAVQARRDVDLVELRGDLRSAWENHFPRTIGYDTTVNELADHAFYLSALVAMAFASDSPHILLASELDSSASVDREGRVVLGRFFMSSAVVVAALDRLLQHIGLRYSSAIMPLPAHQVGALLWTRYRDIADLQYSCWRATEGRLYCAECDKCWGIAGWLVTLNVWPGTIDLDLVHMLLHRRDWAPPVPPADGPSPTALFAGFLAMRSVRMARAKSTFAMARFIARHNPRALLCPAGWRAIAAYRGIRARALASTGLAIGYSPEFKRYVDPAICAPLAQIFEASFSTVDALAPEHIERTEAALAYITEPLGNDPR